MLFVLSSDNNLGFISRSHAALVRSYGLRQECITPHSSPQTGMIEGVIRARSRNDARIGTGSRVSNMPVAWWETGGTFTYGARIMRSTCLPSRST